MPKNLKRFPRHALRQDTKMISIPAATLASTKPDAALGGAPGSKEPAQIKMNKHTAASSAPGARLAVTVGHGQSQTVAVGAAQQQPVAVPRYQYYG